MQVREQVGKVYLKAAPFLFFWVNTEGITIGGTLAS